MEISVGAGRCIYGAAMPAEEVAKDYSLTGITAFPLLTLANGAVVLSDFP